MVFKSVAYCVVLGVLLFAGGAEIRADADQHDFLIISLDGKSVEQFTAIQTAFKEYIAKLAVDYCNASSFQNVDAIDSSTVEIHSILKCPSEWPDSNLCINVNISVPITSSNGYELSSTHLRLMWNTHSNSQLGQFGLKEYEIPSSSTILMLWLCVTGLMFLLFLMILVVVLKTKFIENYIRRRRDILGSSNRSWLAQHGKKQLVPPLFYPQAANTKLKEAQIQYVAEQNMRQCTIGIENPGYDPDLIANHKVGNELAQDNTIIDDFDSDDETIYPPSPLARPVPQRKEGKSAVAVSADELETAF